MGAARNFFAKKHEWSEIKDSILGAYLRPYLAKIARTGKAVRVADCFITGWDHTGRDGYTVKIERNPQWQQTLL